MHGKQQHTIGMYVLNAVEPSPNAGMQSKYSIAGTKPAIIDTDLETDIETDLENDIETDLENEPAVIPCNFEVAF